MSRESFTQIENCIQDQERTIVTTAILNGEESISSVNEIKTVPVVVSYLDTGTKNFLTGQQNTIYSEWLNVGISSCEGWTPSRLLTMLNQPLTQNRDCSQNQERTKSIYNVWANNQETLDIETTESQIIVSNESQNTTGTGLATSCKFILDSGWSTGTGSYTLSLKSGSTYNATCDMDTDGGGWTHLSSQKVTVADYSPILNIDDLELDYTEVLYFDINSESDFGGVPNDNVWDWQGLDFGKNIFKFSGKWSNMAGKFPHVCNPVPEEDKLPESSYRVIEHNVTICYNAGNNDVSSCARKVAVTVPVGTRLEAFSDVETVMANNCAGDNYFNVDYKILVR